MSAGTMRKTRERNTTTDVTKGQRRTSAPRRDGAKSELRLLTTPEERDRLIRVAAYHKAEARGFQGGDSAHDWLEAEAEIDAALANRT